VTRANPERRKKMIGAKCILKSLDKNVWELYKLLYISVG
jgi:hypothetical protein